MSPPHADPPRSSFGAVAAACAALAALACLLTVSAAGAAGAQSAGPSFAAGPSLPVGSSANTAAVGDFDGNGSADLAVANAGYRSNLRILLNDGAGRFRVAPGSPFKAGKYPTSIAKADFDGDGKPDLAVAAEDVRILLGDGAARFSAAPGSPVELPAYPQSVTAAELNGDGRPDLIVVTWSEDAGFALAILLNDGSGRFAALHGPALAGKPYSVSVAVADFNGDGKQDLAVAADTSKNLSIFPGNGTGAFGPATLVLAGTSPSGVSSSDFNGDGRPDLAVFVKAGLAIFLGDGSGGFRPAPGSPIASAAYGYALAIADLDGDGKLDLAFADPSDTSSVAVLLGDGAGGFRPASFSPFYAGWPGALVAGDFNGDGRADLFPLSGGITWGPAPRGNMMLFQTPSTPQMLPGRSLPAKADAVFSTRKPISNLAADGRRAAICADRVIVWTAPARRSKSFNSDCGYISELAVAGGRVAWIEYSYGNTERSVDVFVANASGGRPRQVDGEDDIDTGPEDPSGDWWGQLLGGGAVLAYNAWGVDCVPPPCDQECYDEGGGGCDDANPTLRVRGQVLTRLAGRRPVSVRRGLGAYPLRAVGGGRMAVEPPAGVVVLGARGSYVATVPAAKEDPPRGIALSRTRLALLRTFTLDLYNPATGAKQNSIALGPAAGLELAGVSSKLALLRGKGHLVLVRLSDGKLVSFPLGPAAAKGFVNAKLTTAGLFYAYNLTRGAAKGRVVFEATAKLLARF